MMDVCRCATVWLREAGDLGLRRCQQPLNSAPENFARQSCAEWTGSISAYSAPALKCKVWEGREAGARPLLLLRLCSAPRPTLLQSTLAALHSIICRIKPSSQGLQSPRIQILLEGNSKYVTAVFFFNYCTIVMRSCVQCWQSLQHSGASGAQGRDLTNSTRLPARGL